MNKILVALLFAYSTVVIAGPNIIMKNFEPTYPSSGGVIKTVEEGGFPDGSMVIIAFTPTKPSGGHVSIEEYPAQPNNGANGFGCARTTSISTKAGDFDPASVHLMFSGYNQGIDWVAGGEAKFSVKNGKPFRYSVKPIEVGTKYYINIKSKSPGCGNIRVQFNSLATK